MNRVRFYAYINGNLSFHLGSETLELHIILFLIF